MQRLTANEIPPVALEFFRDDSGRLLISIKGEHQNPIISYNDTILCRAPAGLRPLPIFNEAWAGGGHMGAGSWNTCGYASAGGSAGSGSGAAGGSVYVGSGSSGATGGFASGNAGASGPWSEDEVKVAFGLSNSSPSFNVPQGVTDLKVVVNDVEANIKL